MNHLHAPDDLIAHSEQAHTADFAAVDVLREGVERIPDMRFLHESLTEMSDVVHRLKSGMTGMPFYSDATAPRPSLRLLLEGYIDLNRENDASRRAALCQFLARYVIPLTGLPYGASPRTEAALDYPRHRYVECCEKAEGYFFQAVQQIATGRWHGQPLVSVYHDLEGRPMLLRKIVETSTAITLQPMHMDGMPIVPGTIVQVLPTMHAKKTGESVHGYGVEHMTYRTYELPQRIEIALGRASAAAYTRIIDRQLFALEAQYPPHTASFIDYSKFRGLESLNLANIQLAARSVLQQCGISPPDASRIEHHEASAAIQHQSTLLPGD